MIKTRQVHVRAFTLIELLVVVVIIAILAAIAVVNFLNARIRAQIGRVNGDFAALYTAIEAYRIDNAEYPADYLPYNYANTGKVLPPNTSPWDIRFLLRGLTSPVAYIGSVPAIDPFRYDPKNDKFASANMQNSQKKFRMQYLYLNDGDGPYWRSIASSAPPKPRDIYHFHVDSKQGEGVGVKYLWKTNSVGPDGIDAYKDWINSPAGESYYTKIYDPSNGLRSHGDIWKFGP